MATAPPNGADSSVKPIQLSFPLPNAPSVRISLHLTIMSTSIVLFLTTTSAEALTSGCSLGSFVYAIPNRIDSSAQPLSTPLYTQTATLDTATRMAKILARKSGKPTYVGNSMSFSGMGRGGDAEEEIVAFRRVVEVVMGEVERGSGHAMVNGT